MNKTCESCGGELDGVNKVVCISCEHYDNLLLDDDFPEEESEEYFEDTDEPFDDGYF